MAAYLVNYGSRTEGRIYSKGSINKAKVKDFSGVFIKEGLQLLRRLSDEQTALNLSSPSS